MSRAIDDDLVSDALRELLAGRCTPQVVRDVERGAGAESLWRQLEASGFADALVPESRGGAGLSLRQGFSLLQLAGAYALPVPLSETMLGRALLALAGEAPPPGSICFGRGELDREGRLVCGLVPGGRVADWVLVWHTGEGGDAGVILLPAARSLRSPAVFCLDATLAWAPPDHADARPLAIGQDLQTLQACLYAAQLSGALMSVFEKTVRYANDRIQFGRPIGKFQAIQHQLSVMSEHVFAARMAAQIGCDSDSIAPDPLRAAVAKARASEAALEVAALAHSIHGAIGFTAAFDLQLFTRRLHAWRQAGGSESFWHGVVGSELVDRHHSMALDLIRAVTDTR